VVCNAVDHVVSANFNIDKSSGTDAGKKRSTNAFCCTRPPGHHAGRHGITHQCSSTGFCLLNNVAIAVMHSRMRWNLRRVAIVDFDVHFGNGTAQIFARDADCFFSSVHLQKTVDGSAFFPFPAASSQVVSRPHPNQLLVQVLPAGSSKQSRARLMGRKGFRRAVKDYIVPALTKFRPEIVFLSAGFDGCSSDPLGNALGLQPADFHWATQRLVEAAEAEPACKGRVVSVLEGGYDVSESLETSGLAHCVIAHVKGLTGGPYQPPVHMNGSDGPTWIKSLSSDWFN